MTLKSSIIALTLFAATLLGAGEKAASLAPSITETLFAIGAGPDVVGVSRYCQYPEEIKKLPRVGGFLDPDYEALMRLKPDFVALSTDNPKAEARLKSLGVKTVAVDQRNLPGILKSFKILGEASGHREEAEKLFESCQAKLDDAKRKVANLPKPRVLICMGRSMGGGIREVFAAGSNCFYSDLLEYAGAENVCASLPMKTPTLSTEGVIRLNPDVIIDMAPPRADAKAMLSDWNSLSQVNAVKNGRVVILAEDYIQIPGPRFVLILDKMLEAVHPELKGGAANLASGKEAAK